MPALHADASQVTVSGLSSGGFMAVQMHVAHSRVVKGAGVLAGGPYYCAQASVFAGYFNCRHPGFFTPLPPTAVLKAQTEAFAAAGRIDPLAGLAEGRAWLFSGTRDRTVALAVVEALRAYYAALGVPSVLVRDKPAGHAMVTESFGNRCGTSEAPYVNDCDYDAAGELLGFLLGPLAPPAAPAGRLIRFDQSRYAQGEARAIGLAGEGFAYIASGCEEAPCRIHVAFHGCRQNADAVGGAFVREAGYNRWAESNRLIVLYPQTVARWLGLFNPRGCWDWWGYTGAAYATRDGAQIRAVKAMIDALAR
ncbi:MAG TPA: PHB depolymerase family esterase [Burkholderiales bacterium]